MAELVVLLQFGWILVVMAVSYVDVGAKAMVFDRVRLDGGCHGHSLRQGRCGGKVLRCSSSSSEDCLGDE